MNFQLTHEKALADLQNAFNVDQEVVEKNEKAVSAFAEQLSAVVLDAATKSEDITSSSLQQSIENLRDLTVARDDAFAYFTSAAAYFKAQADLGLRTSEDLAAVARTTQEKATKLFSDVSATVGQNPTANTNTKASKSKPVAKKAA